MAIVRRNPHLFLKAVIAIAAAAVLLVAGLAAAQALPSCRDWKRETNALARHRLKTLYMGNGDPVAVDAHVSIEGSSYAHVIRSLEVQARYDMKDEQPFGCL